MAFGMAQKTIALLRNGSATVGPSSKGWGPLVFHLLACRLAPVNKPAVPAWPKLCLPNR